MSAPVLPRSPLSVLNATQLWYSDDLEIDKMTALRSLHSVFDSFSLQGSLGPFRQNSIQHLGSLVVQFTD